MSENFRNYNTYQSGNAITEDDVNYNPPQPGTKLSDSVMDIDDYNAMIARKVARPVDKKLETYIPFYNTLNAFTAKKLPYTMNEGERRVTNFVLEANETYARKVTRIYKVKSPANGNGLFIKWNEIRFGKTGIGNVREVTADNVGEYKDPELEYTSDYNNRLQQGTVKIKQASKIITRYNLEFNEKRVKELLKDADSPDTIEYVLMNDANPDKCMIVNYEEFMHPDFDAVYKFHLHMVTMRQSGSGINPMSATMFTGTSNNPVTTPSNNGGVGTKQP